jgi:uncharacterized protein (TIGR02145 family)
MKKISCILLFFGLLMSCKKEVSSNNGNQTKVDTGIVSELDCSKAVISEPLKTGATADGLTVQVPYKGGNGKAYSGQDIQSKGVIGLTATLKSDTLSMGDGQFIFNLSGKPTSSGIAKFPLNIGGKSCEFTIEVSELGPNDVSISYLDCGNIDVYSGSIDNLLEGDPVNFKFKMVYQGGNGKTFISKTYNSNNVLGLTAKLEGGTIANGEGFLDFSVTGTPKSSGKAVIPIRFGGRSCNFEMDVKSLEVRQGELISDKSGNSYKTVYIGTQQWMAENLKTSKYSDGTGIPNVTDNTQWENNTIGAWAYYENDAANNSKYGKLYNWYAVSPTTNGNKNVCPSGWHVPTDAEWTVLTEYLGGESIAGRKMKEVGITNWNSPNTDVTNISLFTGLPGGYRDYYGDFNNVGYYGYWWSSSENSTNGAWTRTLIDGSGLAYRFYDNKEVGLSVRCLRD